MASNDKLKIVIDVDAKTGAAEIRKVAGAGDDLDKGTRRASSGMGILTAASRGLSLALGPLGVALAAVGGAFAGYQLSKSFIEAADADEKLTRQLNFALDPMNRYSKEGERLNDWLDELSVKELRGIKGDELNKAALDLENFGISARDNLVALGEAAMQMGDPISNIVETIKMASEGGYRGLRKLGIQVADVARQAGFATAEAMMATEDGLARGTTAILEIIKARFTGASHAAQGEWSVMVNAIGNWWGIFQEKLMQTKVFETLKGWVKGFLDWFDTPAGRLNLDGWATSLGEWIDGAITDIWNFGTNVIGYLTMVFQSENPWEMLWADAYETVSKWVTWLIKYISEKTSEWYQIGLKVGEGIAQGIYDKVKGVVQRAIDATPANISGMHGAGFEFEDQEVYVDFLNDQSPVKPLTEKIEQIMAMLGGISAQSIPVYLDLLASNGLPISEEILSAASQITNLKNQAYALQQQWQTELMQNTWVWNDWLRRGMLEQSYGGRIAGINEQIGGLQMQLAGSLASGMSSGGGYTGASAAPIQVNLNLGPFNLTSTERDTAITIADGLEPEIARRIEDGASPIMRAIEHALARA